MIIIYYYNILLVFAGTYAGHNQFVTRVVHTALSWPQASTYTSKGDFPKVSFIIAYVIYTRLYVCGYSGVSIICAAFCAV